MKKYSTILLLLSIIFVQAQNNNNITLGAHIPKQAEYIPSGAKRLLLNKLGKIITDNGLSDNVRQPRFILTPNVSVISKNITPTAPPQIAINLEITFYIGDGIAGNLYENETVVVKGVGTNELKAYTNALKTIKTKSPLMKDFIGRGKKEILSYYEDQCNNLSATAKSLEAQGKIGEALFTITNIPSSTACFKKHNQKIKSLYARAINEDCKQKLNEALGIWAANQDLEAANDCGNILATIDPRSNCFTDVEKLYNKIADRVKELTDRDWEYVLKELDLEKEAIDAAREIGVAFGNNQAQNINYNTRGWF